MDIKFFEDTDTALVTFSNTPVAETMEINENIYADLDATGKVVALTIEHASRSAALPKFAYEVVSA